MSLLHKNEGFIGFAILVSSLLACSGKPNEVSEPVSQSKTVKETSTEMPKEEKTNQEEAISISGIYGVDDIIQGKTEHFFIDVKDNDSNHKVTFSLKGSTANTVKILPFTVKEDGYKVTIDASDLKEGTYTLQAKITDFYTHSKDKTDHYQTFTVGVIPADANIETWRNF